MGDIKGMLFLIISVCMFITERRQQKAVRRKTAEKNQFGKYFLRVQTMTVAAQRPHNCSDASLWRIYKQ